LGAIMRETMLDLIEDLAARWGWDLREPAHKAQLTSWLDDFGETADPVLVRAFAELTRTCKKLPTYADVRDAIAAEHKRMLARGVVADVCTGERDVIIKPGAFIAACAYAMRRDVDEATKVATIEQLLRGEA